MSLNRRDLLRGTAALAAATLVHPAVMAQSAKAPTSYPPGTIFVSKTASEGFGIGSDAHTGVEAQDPATPFATIDMAVRTVESGGLVVINDGEYSGAELGTDGILLFEGATIRMCTLRAHNAGQVRLLATDPKYLLRIANLASPELALALHGLTLDAGNLSETCIADTSGNGNVHTVRIEDCTLLDPVRRGIQVDGSTWRYYLHRVVHSAGRSRSFFYTTRADRGCELRIEGGATTITQQNDNTAVVQMFAVGEGSSAAVDGLAVTSVFDAGGPDGGLSDGIRLFGVSDVSIANCNISVSGEVGRRGSTGIRVGPGGPWPVKARVSGNTVRNATSGGYGILMGTDASGEWDGQVVDALVSDNAVSGDPQVQVTAIHGIMLGFAVGGEVLRNAVTGCALALLEKRNIDRGGLFALNTVYLPAMSRVRHSMALYSKGALGTLWYHNSIVVEDDSNHDVSVIRVEGDDAEPYTTARDVGFQNNIFCCAGFANFRFLYSPTGNTATFGGNVYFTTASLSSSAFKYDSRDYGSVEAWRRVEPTASGIDPAFIDPAAGDFHLATGSPAAVAGVPLNATMVDRDGNPFFHPPAAGAYQGL